MDLNQFFAESRVPDNFVVVHSAEGYRYVFHVGPDAKGRRVLSPAARIHHNDLARHSAEYFEAAARRFAIREALGDGIIDKGDDTAAR